MAGSVAGAAGQQEALGPGFPEVVLYERKISDTQGGLPEPLVDFDHFGAAVTGLGDLNGDGFIDLAVGSTEGFNMGTGSVWILYLGQDGSILSQVRITDGTAGLRDPGPSSTSRRARSACRAWARARSSSWSASSSWAQRRRRRSRWSTARAS